jgi:Ca-activated chloride channel family protein
MLPENFEIANLWVIWLVPLPLLVYFLFPPLRLKSTSLKFPNFEKAIEYTGSKPRRSALVKRRNMITWFVMIIIWLLLIVSLASPQLVGKPELKVKTSRNFLILADISFSMANEDWTIDGQRVRRWDAVKSVMNDFIQKREGDRMGLIFFGSAAYIQAPFTPDLNTIGYLLEETDVGMAGQMTNIGKGIAKGIDMFARDSIDTKVMLLLTDGVDAGMDILPLDAAEMAKNDSIIIYTIGIGDPNKPGSDLDETTLEQIADLTDGKYFRAMDSEKLEEIYVELDKLEPIEWEEESYKPVTLLYYYPLGAAIGLVILMILINSMVSLFRNRERRETM